MKGFVNAAESSETNKLNLAQRMSINHGDLGGGSWFEHLGTKWYPSPDSWHDPGPASQHNDFWQSGGNSWPAGRTAVQRDLCEHHQYSLFFAAMISNTTSYWIMNIFMNTNTISYKFINITMDIFMNTITTTYWFINITMDVFRNTNTTSY